MPSCSATPSSPLLKASRTLPVPESTTATERTKFGLTLSLLVLSLVLGGGQGGLGDAVLQWLALALLACVFLASAANHGQQPTPLLPWLMVPIVLLVPVIQMLPIPMAWWGADATRTALAAQMAVAGAAPAPHLGLQPLSVERAFWGLLPAIAVFVSASTLPAKRQRWLLGALLGMGLVSLVLGLMQLAEGPDSALRFYSNTNPTEAVGFFANRNHLASLLAACLPLSLATVAYAISERDKGRPIGPLKIVAALGLAVVLILGIALTRSRAGLLLGMLGLLLSVPMLLSLRRRRGVKRVFAFIVAAAFTLTVQFALYGILQRLQADPLADQRWQIATVTVEAASAQSPVGAGLGGFRQMYQSFDTQVPPSVIINHAHDDYLELWLEAGWLFVSAAAVVIALLAWRSIAAWRSEDVQRSLWAKAASISILLLLLHSIVDYPLRTTSNQAVFGLLLAILLCRRGTAVRTHYSNGNP